MDDDQGGNGKVHQLFPPSPKSSLRKRLTEWYGKQSLPFRFSLQYVVLPVALTYAVGAAGMWAILTYQRKQVEQYYAARDAVVEECTGYIKTHEGQDVPQVALERIVESHTGNLSPTYASELRNFNPAFTASFSAAQVIDRYDELERKLGEWHQQRLDQYAEFQQKLEQENKAFAARPNTPPTPSLPVAPPKPQPSLEENFQKCLADHGTSVGSSADSERIFENWLTEELEGYRKIRQRSLDLLEGGLSITELIDLTFLYRLGVMDTADSLEDIETAVSAYQTCLSQYPAIAKSGSDAVAAQRTITTYKHKFTMLGSGTTQAITALGQIYDARALPGSPEVEHYLTSTAKVIEALSP